jgi:hypothetical protein
MTHTPGPWVARKDGTVQPYPGTGSIAACSLRGDHQTMIANARLIAEAPAMLAALRDLLVALEARGAGGCSMDNARAIIARIEGA